MTNKTNSKKWILACGLLLTTACAPSIKHNAEGGLDQNTLEKASGQFCARGQSLKVQADATDALFSDLTFRSKVFAFSKDTDDCIIKTNINDTWVANGANVWFNLNPNSVDNCLKNNSLWEVTSSSTNGFGQYYYLRNIADPSQRLLEMNAHQGVRGTYAKDKVGLKILTCQ